MNVQELLQNKKIDFKANGQDYLIKCLNPEHEDNSPSMRVDQVLGIFNCLSCGYSGNIFNTYNEEAGKLSIHRERLKRQLEIIRSSSVGLSMPVGYVPYTGNWRGVSPKLYEKYNAFRHNEASFIGRICFPLFDESGKLRVFIGRDEGNTLKSKYLFYPKKVPPPHFPIKLDPIQGRIILVEGIFDVLNLHTHGLTNAITFFGLNVNPQKLDDFKIRGISGIDIVFDPDEAGQKAAEKLKIVCEEKDFNTRKVTLKNNKDPGELNANEVLNLKSNLYE